MTKFLLGPLTVLVTLATTGIVQAADPARWTPEDLLRAEAVRGSALSRDGRLAVWIKSSVAKVEGEEKRIGNLWLSRLTETGGAVGEPLPAIELTRGQDTISAPAFSPDGKRIVFVSSKKSPGADPDSPSGQLWALPVDGPGEAWPVTTLDRPVRAWAFADAETIVFAAAEAPTAWELERKERKEEAFAVDDAPREPPVRLFTVKTKGGEVRRLTTNADWIARLTVSPDGKQALVIAERGLTYEFDGKVPPETRLVDLATGATRVLFPDSVVRPNEVAWKLDSSGFFVTNSYSSHPIYRTATIEQVYEVDAITGQASQVDLGWDRGADGNLDATADGGFVVLLADGVHTRLARYSRRGGRWERHDVLGDAGGTVESFHLEGTRMVYTASRSTVSRQLYTATLAGARLEGARRLTGLNPSWAKKPTGRVEVIRWPGARGEEVEGLLHYPLDWRTGERRPLILDIHGGPTSRDLDAWDESWGSPKVLWRQKGAFVLQVNYHGSTGYGLAFVESIGNGNYYDLEIPDLEAGVDFVIAHGLADPDRLATAGWSNGGILSADLITKTTRYKAASVGAADVEWISDWGNVDFGASFDNYYFGGPPWEKTQVYLDKSPFLRLAKVTTPTIVYTGTEDTNVPPHQSWSLFRALRDLGQAETRLIIFPGEPHGLQKLANQRRKLLEDLEWFDRHLWKTPPSASDAVKKGSPLAGLLARAAAAAQGPNGAVGVLASGVLAPETAEFAGYEVGRFEVTRAQWAAFEPSSAPAPGEENLPATGVSFERAKAYAAWLAERTGKAFRLPSVEEAEALSGAAGRDGNSLERWAGYPPNPEDAAAIAAALATKLSGRAALLLPVGSLVGDGEVMVFDLDGNAAEWATAQDGSGKPIGASADRAADSRGAAPLPSAAYVGLRVVVN
jgi:dipeptidyl aminopeptidase/acylaminoacyl peptidase